MSEALRNFRTGQLTQNVRNVSVPETLPLPATVVMINIVE
jgi:hypothetical protein